MLSRYNVNVRLKTALRFGGILEDCGSANVVTLGGLGCHLIRREGQRFFSSLVNGPRQSRWAAMDEARSNFGPEQASRPSNDRPL